MGDIPRIPDAAIMRVVEAVLVALAQAETESGARVNVPVRARVTSPVPGLGQVPDTDAVGAAVLGLLMAVSGEVLLPAAAERR